MTPILFYGVPSGCSFGSIVALEWLGEPYRLCRIPMPEVVSSAPYRRINPVGETPTLLTGSGAVVSESIAILNHIAARSVGAFGFRQGTPEFDRLNQALGFLNTSFFSAFSPLWYLLEHGIDGPAGQALRAYGEAEVRKAHANLNAMLAGRRFLTGERRTVADAYFVGIARWIDYHDVLDRRDYPNVQRLFEALEADPAVAFAHAIEKEQPAQSGGAFAGHVALEEVLSRLDAVA